MNKMVCVKQNKRLRAESRSIYILIACTFLSVFISKVIMQSNDGLNIVSWNSRGMVAALPYLNKLLCNNDIVTISEHWLHSNRLNTLHDISNDFNVIAHASKDADASEYGYSRGQGGVAIMWRKSIGGISPISTLKHDRLCGIRLQCADGRVLNIFAVYMPSPGSSDDYSYVLDEVSEILSSTEEGSLSLICGDFNGDVGYLGGPKSTRKPTSLGKKVMKFFNEFSLIPCNLLKMAKGPINTFRGGVGTSTIDYVAVPQSLVDRITECEVLVEEALNTSDHNAVRVSLNISGLQSACIKTMTRTSVKWAKIPSDVIKSKYSDQVDFCVVKFCPKMTLTAWVRKVLMQ